MAAAVLGISALGSVPVTAAESTETADIGEAMAVDGEAVSSDLVAGTFKPSDVTCKAQDSYEYPFLGLKLSLSKELLKQIEDMGVKIAHVTLHVGLGTFRPVKVEDVTQHHMHSEFYVVEEDQAKLINDTKAAGGRVIAVGTTSCRTLESATGEDGILKAGSGWTEIFIYPGYRFKMIDGLITNFHLPESTLVMLVSALAGKEHIMAAYEEAVREKYRFFSFGDAMFIE